MNPQERDAPTRIRNQIQNYGDPYLLDMKPDEVARCRECRSVFAGGRWQLESDATRELKEARQITEVLCPACQKIRDRVPGGVLSITGRFAADHQEEIVNLVNHENTLAMKINPLERIMDIERSEDGMVVYTTNEKLAQKTGRALKKAYDGHVDYKWPEDRKLVRVNWHRD